MRRESRCSHRFDIPYVHLSVDLPSCVEGPRARTLECGILGTVCVRIRRAFSGLRRDRAITRSKESAEEGDPSRAIVAEQSGKEVTKRKGNNVSESINLAA